METPAESVERAGAGPPSPERASWYRRLFAPERGASDRLLPRWIFLRALGLIYFSAFYSLLFQIRGLIGPEGVLPAAQYVQSIAAESAGAMRFWYAPSLLWISNGERALLALCWVGIVASLLLVLNLWPRLMLAVCFVCFLSFVAAAGLFADFQSDGMLLEAGLISLFLAPSGVWPGLGHGSPPSRFSLFLLQWEWFRIYFQSGIVKLASGDPQWRNFTAMDEYYQNCPLPTWVGWYVQHLPHWFHAATVGATLFMELVLVWMICLPRRFRAPLFFIVTAWQVGVILTANYAFLNYLVLVLGILLVDDRFVLRWVPRRWKSRVPGEDAAHPQVETSPAANPQSKPGVLNLLRRSTRGLMLVVQGVVLTWLFYASSARLVWLLVPSAPLPKTPVALLEPFRVADQYGLFAVMTRGLYQIEFQGSQDGTTWVAYPFRNKPQALNEAPRIYAPYQPRFDWDLWFASLEGWRDNPIVANTEIGLLRNDSEILSLFAANPFPRAAPRQVRAVLWRYWFTSLQEKRSTGNWWRRQDLGLYAPVLQLQPDGSPAVLELPAETGPRP